ncbi:TonB-dependent receptor [Maribellus sp. CM-23]|uniref:TonB-dependent receptor plug domain-containing protein n=1 Tax=Maribellus sp. CM-23 TaxID=2781026 RepID=UPI001F21E8E6|nr:TonB-dependent receptor [Maribellus sp. CM-23]MCE4565534.1 TonB-dependent receptor [Maribellus sp. CM-23]
MNRKFSLILLLYLFLPFCLIAQSKLDSVQHIDEVRITAAKTSAKAIIPAQQLEGAQLKALNSFSVADAIRYFAGVQLKDYGGVGGLKTVDIRSMGTNHMGVFYDGIQLGNAQNGQIDLGKFSLDNIESISLYNGQKSDIFQPARDYGSSGSVYLRFRRPHFNKQEKQHLKATFRTGSFDLVNPSFLYERKLSETVSASLNTEYIYSSGKYKFRYKRVLPGSNEVAYDTTAIRTNGDIYAFRVEAGLYGRINDGNWELKTYFYDSERGIPGAIVNNRWMNAQRQWDTNFFVQGGARKVLTDKYDVMLKFKFANDRMRYLNPDTTLMYIDNTFRQGEAYVSLAQKYAITGFWDVSLSADFQRNWLESDLDDMVYPTRNSTLIALATAIDLGKIKAQASILATLINEKISSGKNTANQAGSAPNKEEFTPAVFFSYAPFAAQNLSFRAFYKHIFRMPTFNDLYYTDIGNIQLQPEFTHQYNLGLKYSKSYEQQTLAHWELQIDGYYNEVRNKIVAVPKGSGMYRWMMMNLGKVEIRGLDVSSKAVFHLPRNVLFHVKGTYTYQKAQDFTRRKNPELEKITWGGQIPYIPWHSGSLIVSGGYQNWQLNYSFIYVGERYHNSANIRENYEQPWYTNDMSLLKNFSLKESNLKIALEVSNLLSQDYEVVLNYPMPKRNYKITLTFEL